MVKCTTVLFNKVMKLILYCVYFFTVSDYQQLLFVRAFEVVKSHRVVITCGVMCDKIKSIQIQIYLKGRSFFHITSLNIEQCGYVHVIPLIKDKSTDVRMSLFSLDILAKDVLRLFGTIIVSS